MRDELEGLLESEHPGWWVGIDVVMEAFGVGRRRAYKLARDYGWRTARGTYPRQYAFKDIQGTYQQLKERQK